MSDKDKTMQGDGDRSAARDAFPWLLLAGFVALAFNLRGPLTAIPPVINDVRGDLDLDAATAGALTSIPVLCFGLLSPVAAALIGRLGVSASIYLTLIGAAVALAARPWFGVDSMMLGTLLLGASLAVGNIASLIVIARDFPTRRGMVTGVYTAALNVGTMMTSAFTAPIALATGWRFALASWVWVALLAAALWFLAERGRPAAAPDQITAPAQDSLQTGARGVLRRPIVWLLAAGFTIHLFVYYAITAWLPAFLMQADGMDQQRAGYVATAIQAFALLGAFGTPLLGRVMPLGAQMALMGALWCVTPIGMLIAPGHWVFWSLTGGLAQGGAFVVLFMLVMRHARDLDDNRRISAVAQGVGYGLASLGPIVCGALHEATGGWTAGFVLLALLSVVLIAVGVMAGRINPAIGR